MTDNKNDLCNRHTQEVHSGDITRKQRANFNMWGHINCFSLGSFSVVIRAPGFMSFKILGPHNADLTCHRLMKPQIDLKMKQKCSAPVFVCVSWKMRKSVGFRLTARMPRELGTDWTIAGCEEGWLVKNTEKKFCLKFDYVDIKKDVLMDVD